MANITLKGNPIKTIGDLPKIGQTAPNFDGVCTDLSSINNDQLKGKNIILIINKADLAPYVGVDLQAMEKDVKNARRELPYVFGEMKNFKGIENISDFLFSEGGL